MIETAKGEMSGSNERRRRNACEQSGADALYRCRER